MITIRAGTRVDLSFIKECAKAAYALYTPRIGREPAPMHADFEGQVERGEMLIACFEDTPVGYLASFQKGDALHIDSVALIPSAQGMGAGKALMDAAEQRARQFGLGVLELYTNEKMTENLSLYPHLGFEEYDRRIENGFSRVYFRKTI